MKKTYNAPAILVTEVKTTIMAGSGPETMNNTPYNNNLNAAHSRYNGIEWLDDEEDDL